MEPLAALVPYPHEHGWSEHGSLAPASALRDRVVSRAPTSAAPASPSDCAEVTHRKTWAELLERTFAVDDLLCPHCGGRRRPIAVITDSLTCRKILHHTSRPAAPKWHTKSA